MNSSLTQDETYNRDWNWSITNGTHVCSAQTAFKGNPPVTVHRVHMGKAEIRWFLLCFPTDLPPIIRSAADWPCLVEWAMKELQ